MSAKPDFVAVDWSEAGSSTVDSRTALAVAGLVALCGLFVYDYGFVGTEPVIFGYDISRLEWLWVVSLWLTLLYVGWPAVRDRDQTVTFYRRLRARPAAFLAGLVVFGIFLVGTFGPVVLSSPEPHLRYGNQPPVFTSVDAEFVTTCLNPVGDRCFGSWRYPLGTTAGGKSLLKMVIFGARTVVMYSFISVTFIVSVATFIGTVSAYIGGITDRLLTGIAETLKIIPGLLVYLVWRWLADEGSLFMLVVSFGVVNWANAATVVRSRALDVVSENYVLRAEASGAGAVEIVRWHLIPNVVRSAVNSAVYQIPLLITIEATLSFLKFGFKSSPLLLIPPTLESWGDLIGDNIGNFFPQWWHVVVPLGALFLTLLSVSVFANGLQAVLDPRSGR